MGAKMNTKASREQLLKVIEIQTELVKLGSDLGGVMQLVVVRALPLIAADGAAIELAEDGEMVYRATSGIAESQLGLRLKMESSLSGLSVMTGEVLSSEDAETDPRVNAAACRSMGLRSMIVLPLKYNGVTIGVLKAMSSKARKFRQKDIDLLGMLTDAVAAAMYFAVKYESDELFIRATHDSMTGLGSLQKTEKIVR
jgi:putative methionine-R-sulfoxide reductase with GAF domain